MSDRIPSGFAELWMSFQLTGDLEAMYTSLGLDIVGDSWDQATTDAVLTIVRDQMKVLCVSAYTVGPGHIIFGTAAGNARIDGTIAAVAGTSGVTCVPQNTATLVRKLTGSGGRRGRGRMYIPGVSEGAVNDAGIIASATVITYNAAMATMRTNLLANAAVSGVVLLHDSAPFTPTPISGFQVQQLVATQRRRLRR